MTEDTTIIESLLADYHREITAPIRLPMSAFAEAYNMTRQGFTQLVNRHGIDHETASDPKALFQFLLDHGNASPLRTKLVSEEFRNKAGEKIDELFFQFYHKRESKTLNRYAPRFKQHAPPPITARSIISAIFSPDPN